MTSEELAIILMEYFVSKRIVGEGKYVPTITIKKEGEYTNTYKITFNAGITDQADLKSQNPFEPLIEPELKTSDKAQAQAEIAPVGSQGAIGSLEIQ